MHKEDKKIKIISFSPHLLAYDVIKRSQTWCALPIEPI